MRLLIIGGSGFLGSELARRAVAAGHETSATYATRPPGTRRNVPPDVSWHALDLRDPARLTEVLTRVAPSVVVDASSGGPDWEVTAEGGVRVAAAVAGRGCRLVHVSSDAVFSGDAGHYDETCLPDPVTPYGAAKAAAETGVRLLAVVRPRCGLAGHRCLVGWPVLPGWSALFLGCGGGLGEA